MSQQHEELTATLTDVIQTITSNDDASDSDLRKVLGFVSEVARVVDQAFSDVLIILTKYRTIQESDLDRNKLPELAQELHNLRTREHFKQAGDICGQLKVLKVTYEDNIEPIILGIKHQQKWEGLFGLLEEREGRVVSLVDKSISRLQNELSRLTGYSGFHMYYWRQGGTECDAPSLALVQRVAAESCDEIRQTLNEMQEIKNGILGLSGRQGLLELISIDRFKLKEAVSHIVGNNVYISKYSIIGGNLGAVGDNPTAHDFTQQLIIKQDLQPVDLKALADQLGQVVAAAKMQATEPEHQMAIGVIEAAKAAAEKGDESKAMTFLKSAGKWTWDIATDIGAKIAAEMIKAQTGLG